MPTFIPARGRTLHVAGVCINRIGSEQTMSFANKFHSVRGRSGCRLVAAGRGRQLAVRGIADKISCLLKYDGYIARLEMGNSLAVRLPKEIVEAIGLPAGEELRGGVSDPAGQAASRVRSAVMPKPPTVSKHGPRSCYAAAPARPMRP